MIELLTESPLTPTSTLGPYRAADYMGLPDEPRCELIYGRFYVSPSPLPSHQTAVLELGVLVHALENDTGGREYVSPLDVTLADHAVVQPDVIYVSAERREIIRERIEGAPDLLVEVLSPSTTRRDRNDKLKLYAEAGVSEYWLVDTDARHIEFLVLSLAGSTSDQPNRFVVQTPRDGVYRSPVIEGLEVDIAAFWAAVEARIA